MTGRGIVVSSCGPGLVKVRVPRLSACGRDCSSCGGCAVSGGAVEVVARDELGAPAGSRVVFQSGTGRALFLAAVVYLLPPLLFIAGWLAHPAAGAAGFAAGVGAVLFTGRRLRKSGGVHVRIVSVDYGPEGRG